MAVMSFPYSVPNVQKEFEPGSCIPRKYDALYFPDRPVGSCYFEIWIRGEHFDGK